MNDKIRTKITEKIKKFAENHVCDCGQRKIHQKTSGGMFVGGVLNSPNGPRCSFCGGLIKNKKEK